MDDTLLAGDAEAAWAKYMAENGLMKDEGFAEKIRRFDEDYRRGDLDFSVYTEFLLSSHQRNDSPRGRKILCNLFV